VLGTGRVPIGFAEDQPIRPVHASPMVEKKDLKLASPLTKMAALAKTINVYEILLKTYFPALTSSKDVTTNNVCVISNTYIVSYQTLSLVIIYENLFCFRIRNIYFK
jgi:hypothetical protein